MAQVSIIGGGNVGANAAFFIAEKGVTDVLLVDIQAGLARGKMLDIMEAAPIRRYRNFLSGSDSLAEIKGSEFVVVAAGAIRSPGMRREDLFTANAGLIRLLAPEIARLAPDSIVVIATEPVDGLTALFTQVSGMPRSRVLGLGGILDSAARTDRPRASPIDGNRFRHGDRAAFGRHGLPSPLLQCRGRSPSPSPSGREDRLPRGRDPNGRRPGRGAGQAVQRLLRAVGGDR